MIKEITVTELKTKIDAGEKPFLLDVREDEEVTANKLDFDQHIPLGDLVDDYQKLPKDQAIVVYCRRGVRSQRACEFLIDRGYDVTNMVGGITAWAKEIDPSMFDK